MRYQLHTQDLGSIALGLFKRARHLDAAALAASAGVDLRLDYHAGRTARKEPLCDLNSFVERVRDFALRHGHAVFPQDVLGLVLVYFHLFTTT